MAKYSLPPFEEIDLEDLDGYYDAEIDFNGEELPVQISFDDITSIDASRLDLVAGFIKKIESLNEQNLKLIHADYVNPEGETVKEYIEFHLRELDEDALQEVLEEQEGASNEEKLLNALHLVDVAFYPHEEEMFAIFDYSFSTEISNYIVVIGMNDKGEIVDLTMES